jgi:hypothetical protein
MKKNHAMFLFKVITISVVGLTLTACGPSAYEKAEQTLKLSKCHNVTTFDDDCIDAVDIIAGAGAGVKEKARLEMIERNKLKPIETKTKVKPLGNLGGSSLNDTDTVK